MVVLGVFYGCSVCYQIERPDIIVKGAAPIVALTNSNEEAVAATALVYASHHAEALLWCCGTGI